MSTANGKKPTVAVAKALRSVKFSNPADKDGQKLFPTLYELLCPIWTDGRCLRQNGKLTLRVEGGIYLVSIECPTEGLQTTIPTGSLASALADAEKAVNEGVANWGATWQKRKKFLPTVDDLIE